MAGRLEAVGGFNPCNGLLNEIFQVYIARDLRHVGARPDETEAFEPIRLTADEVEAFIQDGTIWDGMTMAAWAMVRSRFLKDI